MGSEVGGLTVLLAGVCDVGLQGLDGQLATVGVHGREAHESHHGCAPRHTEASVDPRGGTVSGTPP